MQELDSIIHIPALPQAQRLDAVLAKLLPSYSRSQLSLWLKEGKIKLNSKQVKPREQVFGGEEIDLSLCLENLTARVENWQPEKAPLSIVAEDEEFIIISKPAGLIVHPGAGNPSNTLVNALLYYHPPLQNVPRAGIIHRLDKDTTGLLVVAKTLVSHASLTRQMQAREIQRRYITLVKGHLISGGEISTFYGRHPRNRLKMAVCKQGREAITKFTIRKQYQTYTLLDVSLETGRTHQIRVHMAHLKHPVVGDFLYGWQPVFPKSASEELINSIQNFKRQALHACSLSFYHPTSNELLTFEAEMPDDFAHLLQVLDSNV